MHDVLITAPEDPRFADFAGLEPRLPAVAQAALSRRFAQYGRRRHFLLLGDGRPVGRLTASINPRVAPAPEGPVGFLGDLVFPDDAAALRALLVPALAWLGAEGCSVARAPITYHTWLPYRFVTGGDRERPPFPGEPSQPPHQPERFLEAGFGVHARYTSAETDALDALVEASARDLAHLAASGLRIRPFDLADAEAEVARLHALASVAFVHNDSYAGIEHDEFAALYAPVVPRLDPRIVLLCEDPGAPDELAGVVFCLRDPSDTTGGTAVLKTLAVHPARRGQGLGGALVARAHGAAAAAGYRRIVHALMIEADASSAISRRGARVFRDYAVVEKRLGAS